MAASLKCPWMAVYVENIRHHELGDAEKAAVETVMRMVERLGGRIVILQGDNALEEIIAYARNNAITKIILGKPSKPRWREIVYGSLVDKLVRRSGVFDVYVIAGESVPVSSLFYQPLTCGL